MKSSAKAPKRSVTRGASVPGRLPRSASVKKSGKPAKIWTSKGDAFVWEAAEDTLAAVDKVSRLPLSLLLGVEPQRDTLFENTRRFADGLPANNALLWGARGMGKSSPFRLCHSAPPSTIAAPRCKAR